MSYIAIVVQRGAARFGLVLPVGLIAFLGVGVAGLAVNLVLLTVLEALKAPFWMALAGSLVAATLVTWVLNRRLTFAASGRAAHHEALRYFGVAFAAQSVNYAVSLAAAAAAPRLPHVAAALLGAVVATLFSYTGQRFFTFAPVSSSVSKPEPEV
jgi:putative flippase GtrA